ERCGHIQAQARGKVIPIELRVIGPGAPIPFIGEIDSTADDAEGQQTAEPDRDNQHREHCHSEASFIMLSMIAASVKRRPGVVAPGRARKGKARTELKAVCYTAQTRKR